MDSKTVSSSPRYQFAENLIVEAGQMALSYFSDLSQLEIEKKAIRTWFLKQIKMLRFLFAKNFLASFPMMALSVKKVAALLAQLAAILAIDG